MTEETDSQRHGPEGLMVIGMKKILEEIKETYGSMKTEIIFMLLFVLLFILLNGRQLAEEASVIYGSGGTSVRSEGGARRDEPESETDGLTAAETAAGQDGALPEGKESSLLLQCLRLPAEAALRAPMAMPEAEEASVPYRFSMLCLRRNEGAAPADGGQETVEYRDLGQLKRMVQSTLSDYDGDWSVYVKNLKTDESFVINDRPMKSASVMKLFVMGTVYKAIEAGELERTDEVVSLLKLMITESDNEASNQLLYRLGDSSYADGIKKVDAFIAEYGFSSMTVEYNGFNNSETVLDPDHNNQVSAKDCGKLLEDVYRRAWMNRSTGVEIEQMMLDQKTRYKIPAGLPDGVLCGNKTGEMETTENDAAIVYGESCDYILVILSSDWESKNQAIWRITDLSELIYGYLNPDADSGTGADGD